MTQPQYTESEVRAMTNEELANELAQWAAARDYVAKQRVRRGQLATDAKLLHEAVRRLRSA